MSFYDILCIHKTHIDSCHSSQPLLSPSSFLLFISLVVLFCFHVYHSSQYEKNNMIFAFVGQAYLLKLMTSKSIHFPTIKIISSFFITK